MRAIVPALLVAFLVSLWTLTTTSESRTTYWTCELDAFVVGEATQRIEKRPELDGRGLVTCRNVGGFDFSVPVEAKVRVSREASAMPPEQMKLTIDSSPFVVGHDLNQLYDLYSRQADLEGVSGGDGADLTMIGKRSGLLLPVRIALPAEAAGTDLNVEDLQLEYDSSAPDLE